MTSKMDNTNLNLTSYETGLMLTDKCSDDTFDKLTYDLRKKYKIKIHLTSKKKKSFKVINLITKNPRPLSFFNKIKAIMESIFKQNNLKFHKVTTDKNSSTLVKKTNNKLTKKRRASFNNKKNLSNQSQKTQEKVLITESSPLNDKSVVDLDASNSNDIIDLTKPNNDNITLIDLTNSNNTISEIQQNNLSTPPPKRKTISDDVVIIDLTQSFIESPQLNANSMNLFNPNQNNMVKKGLRPVIIDGSNVAMSHSNGKFFSWKGIEIMITYFKKRGHRVLAFVPQYRQHSSGGAFKTLVNQLLDRQELVLTPSRTVDGKILTPYDDRYIVQCAVEFGGVIVSSDNYRDLMRENPSWKETITNRLLMFTWVGDMLIFPQDPLGRHGPKLDQFLQFP